METKHIKNIPQGKIKNVATLPCGLNAPYLKCLVSHAGDYIATSWHRKIPKDQNGYVLISFAEGGTDDENEKP